MSRLINTVPTSSSGLSSGLSSAGSSSGSSNVTKSSLGLGLVDNTSDISKPISTLTQNALNLKLNTSEKGATNGVASLVDGKVPSDQLPIINDLTTGGVDKVLSAEQGKELETLVKDRVTGSLLQIGTYRQSIGQTISSGGEGVKLTGFGPLNSSTQWDNANHRFLITIPGNYTVRGRISWASNGTSDGIRQVLIRRGSIADSTVTTLASASVAPSPDNVVTCEVEETVNLSVDQTIELWGFQNSLSDINTVRLNTGQYSLIEIVQLPSNTTFPIGSLNITNSPTAGFVLRSNTTDASWVQLISETVSFNFTDISNLRIAWGSVSAGSTGERTVTFPAIFNGIPTVYATVNNGASPPLNSAICIMVGNVTTSNFSARLITGSGTASGAAFSWFAVGRRTP